jgi:lysophospholipase L1-like esterase
LVSTIGIATDARARRAKLPGVNTQLVRRIAACALLLIVTAGCSERPTIHAPATVLVVGDSILDFSKVDVATTLEHAGWTPTVDARRGSRVTGGFTIGSWPQELATRVARAKPDVVVVELGTNGCGFCNTDSDGIDAVMRSLRSVRRVYWVNVRVDAPIPEDPAAFNRALQQARLRWPNLHVIDMNKTIGDDPKLILADHVHPTPRGEQAIADMIEAALPKVVRS